MYVREIISGVERMKSGDLMEEIPVQGEDEFSEIAASINEMRQNLYETMESQKAEEKTKDELIILISLHKETFLRKNKSRSILESYHRKQSS